MPRPIHERRRCRQRRQLVTRVFTDISVNPDFNGLPTNVYNGLVHLTDNAAAILTPVAGLGLTVSLIGLVIASFTANRELSERTNGGIAGSVFSVALLYIRAPTPNYSGPPF